VTGENQSNIINWLAAAQQHMAAPNIMSVVASSIGGIS